jgi:hypothetical protein
MPSNRKGCPGWWPVEETEKPHLKPHVRRGVSQFRREEHASYRRLLRSIRLRTAVEPEGAGNPVPNITLRICIRG